MTMTHVDAASGVADDPTPAEVRFAAHEWRVERFAVVPVRADGSKAPALTTWKGYCHSRTLPTDAEHEQWFNGQPHGVGLLCGAVSGGLEMFELEGRAIAEDARDRLIPALRGAGIFDLWRRLTGGYAEFTPSGGLHLLYRITDHEVPGNTKIAQRPARADELTDDERAVLEKYPNKVIVRCLAETRGENGFVVVAPSHGPTHDTGRSWLLAEGARYGHVPTITWEERVALHAVVHMVLDEMPEPAAAPRQPRTPAPATADGERPGDAWGQQTEWADILQSHGWQWVYRRGDMDFWRRPGKRIGVSARTGGQYDGLYVWSTSTEFPTEQSITKFKAYSILEHRGNDRAAAVELRRQGFGGNQQANGQHVRVSEPVTTPPVPAPSKAPKWPVMHADARYGLAGEYVSLYDPYTEADPNAVLMAFIAAAGCYFGPDLYIMGGNKRHPGKVWPLIVGDTAVGAKGTALAVVEQFFLTYDKIFSANNLATGLSSSEGLIRLVRDRSGDDPGAVGFDDGVDDKRKWIDAPEFASVLERSRREGNTLSATLREAYDFKTLQTITSHNPLKSTGSHIVITPQITPTELIAKLSATDVANGLANRFMPTCSKMSKRLPDGANPPIEELKEFGRRFHTAYTKIQRTTKGIQTELRRTEIARKIWHEEYNRRFDALEKEDPGPAKAMMARWHANSARMSVIYALLDGCLEVDEPHIRASLAAWAYVEQSIRYLFTNETSNPDLGRLVEFVNNGEPGRTRSEISTKLFRGHKTKKELDDLCAALLKLDKYELKNVETEGRTARMYIRRGLA